MKKLMLSMLVLVACSAEPAQENVATVEQALCPASLQCTAPPGYPIFYSSVNPSHDQNIVCTWRNSAWQFTGVPLVKPAGCKTCCAAGWCPDPKYSQPVFSGAWTCNAP
jgi:hypothetical protein